MNKRVEGEKLEMTKPDAPWTKRHKKVKKKKIKKNGVLAAAIIRSRSFTFNIYLFFTDSVDFPLRIEWSLNRMPFTSSRISSVKAHFIPTYIILLCFITKLVLALISINRISIRIVDKSTDLLRNNERLISPK